MPTTSKPFTKSAVDALTPSAKDQLHWEGGDGAVKGFGVKVTPAGRKVFVLQYSDAAGTRKRVTIGQYGALTVPQGREMARQLAADARAARLDATRDDPATARARAKRETAARHAAPTVADLGARYLDGLRRKRKSAETIRQYEGILRRYVGPAIGARKVADIVRRDVAALHEEVSASKPTMANRVVNLLSAMFTLAEREEWRDPHTNPCRGVEKNPERLRARVVAEAEYRALGAALARIERYGFGRVKGIDQRPSQSAGTEPRQRATPAESYALTPHQGRALLLFRFLALSGWREGEGRGLRWSEVDRTRGVATLPHTKTGRSVRPLGRAALAVLERVRALPVDAIVAASPFVFPASGLGRTDRGTAGEASEKRTGHVRRLWTRVWAVALDELRQRAGETVDPDERHTLDAIISADDPLTLHDLRHGFITTARELGYGESVTAVLVGHKVRGGMTSRYGGVPDAVVRRAGEDTSATVAARLDDTPAKVLAFPTALRA